MFDLKTLLQHTTNRIIAVTSVVYFVVEALFAGAPNPFELYSWNTPYFGMWQFGYPYVFTW